MWMAIRFACCGSDAVGDATLVNQETIIAKIDALSAVLVEHDSEVQRDLEDDDIIIT